MIRALAVTTTAAVLLVACGTDRLDHGRSAASQSTDGGAEPLQVQGTVADSAIASAPPAAKVVVLWHFGRNGEEGLYKWGDGTSAGRQFTLRLPAAPPTDAFANGEVGIGVVVLVAASASLPDGPVAGAALRGAVLGGATHHAVIYITGAPSFPFWVAGFPVGWSCGGPRFLRTGGVDGFIAAPCGDVQIELGSYDSLPFVDWR